MKKILFGILVSMFAILPFAGVQATENVQGIQENAVAWHGGHGWGGGGHGWGGGRGYWGGGRGYWGGYYGGGYYQPYYYNYYPYNNYPYNYYYNY